MPPARLSPESQRHRANTLFQFGGIRASQGRLAESLTNYQAAIAGYTALVSAHPTNLQWRYELSRVRNDLGIVYARQRDYSNGIAQFTQVLQDRGSLLALEPTNVIWLAACGATAQNLAILQRRLGRFDEAGDNLDRAERAYRTWVKADPTALVAKERLATVRGSVGQLLAARKNPEAAAEAYADQVGILHELRKQDPDHKGREASLVVALSYGAELQMARSNFVAALSALAEGVQLGEELVAHDPANREWQSSLVTHLTDRGLVLRQLKRPDEALASFRRACELSAARLEVTRQYSEWLNNYRQALENAEELEHEAAGTARLNGQAGQAAEHEQAAGKLHGRLTDLSK
jgi:tetratricopeptide (TPR) repeat protein